MQQGSNIFEKNKAISFGKGVCLGIVLIVWGILFFLCDVYLPWFLGLNGGLPSLPEMQSQFQQAQNIITIVNIVFFILLSIILIVMQIHCKRNGVAAKLSKNNLFANATTLVLIGYIINILYMLKGITEMLLLSTIIFVISGICVLVYSFEH